MGSDNVSIDTTSELWHSYIYYYTASKFGWTPEQTDEVPYKLLLTFLQIEEVNAIRMKMESK